HYKQFSSSFDIPVYNYFDYVQAWHNTFLFQNIEDKHSWFFCFDKTFNSKQIIPYWFIDWWTFYGPNQYILPPSVEEALDTFASNIEDIPFWPIMASFFIHCKLSWIMYWDYTIEEAPRTLPTLHRQSWTKWWKKYDLSKCTPETILRSLKIQQNQHFTQTKSQIQTTIASSSKERELKEQIKKLQEALEDIPDEDDDKVSITSTKNLGDDEDFIPTSRRKNKEKVEKD
ncbi:hypothetical protein CFOL_v3_33750, partial [Cephalotus follicularis]